MAQGPFGASRGAEEKPIDILTLDSSAIHQRWAERGFGLSIPVYTYKLENRNENLHEI